MQFNGQSLEEKRVWGREARCEAPRFNYTNFPQRLGKWKIRVRAHTHKLASVPY